MVDFTASQKKQLATYKDRLARVKREENAAGITRLKIARMALRLTSQYQPPSPLGMIRNSTSF